MLRKDYLVKQFEEFGLVLSKILQLKSQQKFDLFEEEMEQLLDKYGAIALKQLEKLSPSDLKQTILQNNEIDFTQKRIMARVLFEKMMYYEENGMNEASDRIKTLCLDLYEHIQENTTENEFDLDAHYKLSFLRNSNQIN